MARTIAIRVILGLLTLLGVSILVFAATEILPGVFVSCGRPDQRFLDKHNRMQRDFDAARARGEAGVNPGKLLPRLIFEAPRSITILRKELYERSDRERLARRIADENDIPVERARALVK